MAASLARTVAGTALAIAASPAGAQPYAIVDLGTLGGSSSRANAVLETGRVAGWATTAPGVKHAALWNGSIVDLGAPDGFVVSEAVAVNAAGRVAGNAEGNPQAIRAYFWEDDSWTALGVLPGRTESIAEDIDSSGRIVGRSLTLGAGNGRGFLWEDGVLTDLGTLGGTTEAYGMNDVGQIVGRSGEILPDDTVAPRAFLWEDGAMASLGVLPGEDFSQAFDVNDLGEAVGSSWHLTSPNFLSADQATLWRDGGAQIVDLGLTPGPPVCADQFPFYTDNIARAINNLGQVVGDAQCVASGGALAAFLWQDGVMRNLNDLIPAGSGWNLLGARDIDDAGEIVGFGIAPGGGLHGFRLTPVGPVGASRGPTLPRSALVVAPNPFAGATRVFFELRARGPVRVSVYDVRGRRIATLANGPREQGRHALRWDAASDAGERLPGGIYFVRLVSGKGVAVRKTVLMR